MCLCVRVVCVWMGGWGGVWNFQKWGLPKMGGGVVFEMGVLTPLRTMCHFTVNKVLNSSYCMHLSCFMIENVCFI